MTHELDAVGGTLRELGLSDREVEVYLALLQVGTAPASVVAQRTGMTRSTAQYTCQQLHKRGVITMVQKANAYLYTADEPERLLSLLHARQEELHRQEEDVHRIIGALKQMQNPHSVLPRVRFYEGVNGIAAAYRDVLEQLEPGGEILSYVHPLAPAEDTLQLMPVVREFVEGRVAKKVRARVIAVDGPVSRSLVAGDAGLLRETRIMQGEPAFAPTEILLYNDCVYSLAAERHAVTSAIVQNGHMTALHRLAFEALWGRLGRG